MLLINLMSFVQTKQNFLLKIKQKFVFTFFIMINLDWWCLTILTIFKIV